MIRWGEKYPAMGKTRVVRVFLPLPTCICGEWRWLGKAYIEQTFIGFGKRGYWEDVRWADGPEDLRYAHPIHYRPERL